MILKEETKMKKFQKIQLIYDKKFKSLAHQSNRVQAHKGPKIDNSASRP
jgi:hypothetical protein